MATFRFTLQAALDDRARAEEDRARAFAQAQAAARESEQRLRVIEARLNEITRVLAGGAAPNLQAAALRGARHEVEALVQTARTERKRALSFIAAQKAAQRALDEARLEHGQLAALRDRELAAFQAAAEQREEREIEESNRRSTRRS
ncbi:MAG TPA: hypothetical protein VGD50_07595 [Candidatus Baltobacteraceae bacterium]